MIEYHKQFTTPIHADIHVHTVGTCTPAYMPQTHTHTHTPEWSLDRAWQLDGLRGMSVKQVEIVELRERGGVLYTGGGLLVLKVTVSLH